MFRGLLIFFLCPLVFSAAAVADDVGRWQALYKEHCSACHGENGDGQSRARFGLNPPPRDFTSAASRDELTPERMRTSITYGRPGTAMVAWGKRLSKAQIDGLVHYIRTTFMQNPAPSTGEDGARLYKRHCAACHGDRGSGAQWTQNSLNPPPRDFTADRSREELSQERMITSVTYGRPGTAMMSFKKRLTTEQIQSVVGYIRHEFMKVDKGAVQTETAAVPATRVDMSLAFPHGLVGDALKGRQFYVNNCYTCHGKKGDGHGPRSSFISPKPRNFLSADSRQRFNRPALFHAISNGKPGTIMPAWSKVLDDQQIADVAEYVFQDFIRPDAVKKKVQNSPY